MGFSVPKSSATSVPEYPIERHIHLIRGQKVMLGSDLAALYGAETKMLNRAVARNRDRIVEHALAAEDPNSHSRQHGRAFSMTNELIPFSALTPAEFGGLADVPPELEWLANIANA
jgi:hypothetical protein